MTTKEPGTILEILLNLYAILRLPRIAAERAPLIRPARGLGDTIHNISERLDIGSRVRRWFAAQKRSCGCPQRHAKLNVWSLAAPWGLGRLFRWMYRPSGVRPLITIGMPHFKDWEGAWGTIESTLAEAEAAGVLHLIEILVVSQSPDSEADKKLVGFLKSRAIRAKYVPMQEPQGTCPAKNAVFGHASGEWVTLIDCHAAWKAGSFGNLVEWIREHRFDGNLYGGVMELGTAYQWHRRQHVEAAKLEIKGRLSGKNRTKVPSIPEASIMHIKAHVAAGLTAGKTTEEICDTLLGTDRGYHSHLDRKWSGNMLGQWATDKRAEQDNAPPFEVDNLAGWFLICRRDAWLAVQPYHPLVKGFGGEEGVNAWAFRRRGRKACVLPLARASHRFGRADAQGFSNTQEDRIRNYALPFHALGDAAEFERMRAYFIADGLPLDSNGTPVGDSAFVWMVARRPGESETEHVARNAERVDTIIAGAIADHEQMKLTATANHREQHYQRAASTPSDINEHAPTLRRLASECEHVTEMGTRHGVSSVAFLAAQPKTFVTIDLNCPACTTSFLEKIKGETDLQIRQANSLEVEIEETDLLFIDTFHAADHVFCELSRHSVKARKYIALHDTEAPYGYADEGGTPGGGIRAGLARWQETEDGQRWQIAEDRKNNHGLTVLKRLPA